MPRARPMGTCTIRPAPDNNDSITFSGTEEGDRVYVTGTLDGDLFDGFEVDAGSVVELSSSG